jgi:hypothetical protein
MDAHNERGKAHAILECDVVYSRTQVPGFYEILVLTYQTTRRSLHAPNIQRYENWTHRMQKSSKIINM